MSNGPCADCFSGFVHDGTPSGKISTIHGLPTYVAEPEEGVKPKGLIVMIHDAFGMELVNNKILADRYAKRGGFLVYLPDFMGGNALPISIMELSHKIMAPAPSWFAALFYRPLWVLQAMIAAIPWFIKTRPSVSKPRVISFFQALRTSPPPFPTTNLKIGAAGFCWGGKYTVLLCQDSPSTRVHRNPESSSSTALLPLIDCGFTAHPSMLSVPKDINEVVLPLSVAVGNEDMAMKGKDILLMKEILEKKKAGDHEVVIMPGAKHGFAIRNDPKNQLQMECAENAELQAIDWFKRWFS